MGEHDVFEWVSVVLVPVVVAAVGLTVDRRAKRRVHALSEQNSSQHTVGRGLVDHVSTQLNQLDRSLHSRFDRLEDRIASHDDRLLAVEMKIIGDAVGQPAPIGDEGLPTRTGQLQLDLPVRPEG